MTDEQSNQSIPAAILVHAGVLGLGLGGIATNPAGFCASFAGLVLLIVGYQRLK